MTKKIPLVLGFILVALTLLLGLGEPLGNLCQPTLPSVSLAFGEAFKHHNLNECLQLANERTMKWVR